MARRREPRSESRSAGGTANGDGGKGPGKLGVTGRGSTPRSRPSHETSRTLGTRDRRSREGVTSTHPESRARPWCSRIEVIPFPGNIRQAFGFPASHVRVIIGEGGLAKSDTSESTGAAEAILTDFRFRKKSGGCETSANRHASREARHELVEALAGSSSAFLFLATCNPSHAMEAAMATPWTTGSVARSSTASASRMPVSQNGSLVRS